MDRTTTQFHSLALVLQQMPAKHHNAILIVSKLSSYNKTEVLCRSNYKTRVHRREGWGNTQDRFARRLNKKKLEGSWWCFSHGIFHSQRHLSHQAIAATMGPPHSVKEKTAAWVLLSNSHSLMLSDFFTNSTLESKISWIALNILKMTE